MSQNENGQQQMNMFASQNQKTLEENDWTQKIEDVSIQQNDFHSTLGEQEQFKLNETAQQQSTTLLENQQQIPTSKSQIESLSARVVSQRPQSVQQEVRQQSQLNEGSRTFFQQSPDSKKIHSSQQKITLNDSLIAQHEKKIKTHLLLSQLQKPKIMESFPFSSVGMYPHNQMNQMNLFFYDNQIIENANLQNTQRERKQIQGHLQALQNRVQLLEKEDKKALIEFKNMQKLSQKALIAKRNHEERQQLNEYIRIKRENDQQQKLIENTQFKNMQRENIQSRISQRNQSARQKSEVIKDQLYKLKMQQGINIEQQVLSNIQSINTIKYSQKQAQISRITYQNDKRQLGSNQYNQRIMVEEAISSMKQQEYLELQEKEKQLLERLQTIQGMLNNAVEDMQKVISIQIKNKNNPSNDDLNNIKKNITQQNQVTPQSQRFATNIADDFITQVNQHKLNYSTYKFQIPIENAQENNQYQKVTLSGNQQIINAAVAAANSQGSPQHTLSTQQPNTNRSDQDQGRLQLQLTLQGQEEEQQGIHKLRSNQVYSTLSQRRYRPKQQSQQSSSIVDSRDPLASTTSSTQFKQLNTPNFDTIQFSGRNNSTFQQQTQNSMQQNRNYSKMHVNIPQNLSQGNLVTRINIGQPFTPIITNNKTIRQSAK